jgi:transcriptional regulator GlxA family with amidase domain
MSHNCEVIPVPRAGAGNVAESVDSQLVSSPGRPAVSRLDTITDWGSRAEEVGFNVAALAKGCGVTDRQLRRYFQCKFGSTPHAWMALARLQKVQPLLFGGALVKEVAVEAGFSKQTNFSRQFKRYFNFSPSDFRDVSGRMLDRS